MADELWRMSAAEAVARLRKREISPLELVDASARRIGEVEPAVNALPTVCLDRARDHARRIMRGGAAREAEGEPGWLAGLPVSIKDLTDVAGVRTTYGSPLFADHLPAKSHPLVERIERKGGIVMGKSNTPEFGAGGSTFNEVFGRTRNPWNTSLTSGGSTGGGAVSVATGEVWLAQGSDHGGSLRGPGSHCSVVGLRPSPGRVTRGTVGNLWSQLSVQGPMARNVADLALFLDTMAGFCPLDPLTFDAPAISFSDGLARPAAPRRVAFTADYHGRMPIDREVREICARAARRFEELGCIVEEVSPDIGAADEAFQILRSQHFVVDRELQLRSHRDKLKPDIVWNTERGLAQTPSDIARAERERAAFYRRIVEFFGTYDLLVTPGAPTPAFDVNLRNAPTIGGQKPDNYMGGSTLTAVSPPVPRWPFRAVSINSAGQSACNSSASRAARRRCCKPPCSSSSCSVSTGSSRSTRGRARFRPQFEPDPMPLQNRVTPIGDIVAIPQRGIFTGNRGIIHDPAIRTLLARRWASKAWLVCLCEFKGRWREVMGRRSWTELFFLDEAVALAAGHRPRMQSQSRSRV